jgi:hypothetical protein
MVKEKLKLLAEKFTESWTACMLMMVQGDLTVLTLNHAYTASKTGIIAGIAIVVSSYWNRVNHKYGLIWMTGVLTAIADFVVHPSQFGPQWAEALLTGVTAGLLAWILSKREKNIV